MLNFLKKIFGGGRKAEIGEAHFPQIIETAPAPSPRRPTPKAALKASARTKLVGQSSTNLVLVIPGEEPRIVPVYIREQYRGFLSYPTPRGGHLELWKEDLNRPGGEGFRPCPGGGSHYPSPEEQARYAQAPLRFLHYMSPQKEGDPVTIDNGSVVEQVPVTADGLDSLKKAIHRMLAVMDREYEEEASACAQAEAYDLEKEAKELERTKKNEEVRKNKNYLLS